MRRRCYTKAIYHHYRRIRHHHPVVETHHRRLIYKFSPFSRHITAVVWTNHRRWRNISPPSTIFVVTEHIKVVASFSLPRAALVKWSPRGAHLTRRYYRSRCIYNVVRRSSPRFYCRLLFFWLILKPIWWLVDEDFFSLLQWWGVRRQFQKICQRIRWLNDPGIHTNLFSSPSPFD